MKLFKLNSDHSVYINPEKYIIDWDRKVSKPQKAVKDFLRPFWDGDSVYEEFLIPGSKKRLDLFNWTKKIVVEVSPDSTHKNFNKFMHRNRSMFVKMLKTDQNKFLWAEKNNLVFISLDDNDIKSLSVDLFLQKGVRL